MSNSTSYDASALMAGYSGIFFSITLSIIGGGIGSYKAFKGIAHLSLSKPSMIMKNMIPIIMAGVIAIYGLILSVIITGKSNLIIN